MLSGFVDSAFDLYKEDRHEFQNDVIDMIGNGLKNVEEALLAEQKNAKADAADPQGVKARRKAAAAKAESELANLKSTEEAKKAAEKDAGILTTQARQTHKEALSAQKQGDVSYNDLANKLADVQDAQSSALASLKEKSTKKGGAKDLKRLETVAKAHGVDSSLLSTIAVPFEKEPANRGSFDQTIIAEFEAALAAVVAKLQQSLKEAEPGRAARAAAVDSAFQAKETAEAGLNAAIEAHEAASAARAAGSKALTQARHSVAHFLPDMKRVFERLDGITGELTELRGGPLADFAALKERTAPPPEPEAQPEAAAEAPTEAAVEVA